MKDISMNEFWNGINAVDYELNIIMYNECMTLENRGNITISDKFKYRDLQEKLEEYFNRYNKILFKVPYSQLKRRVKTLTEKLGYKVERTTYYDADTDITDMIYLVLTK